MSSGWEHVLAVDGLMDFCYVPPVLLCVTAGVKLCSGDLMPVNGPLGEAACQPEQRKHYHHRPVRHGRQVVGPSRHMNLSIISAHGVCKNDANSAALRPAHERNFLQPAPTTSLPS
jgi:hypothetical protein